MLSTTFSRHKSHAFSKPYLDTSALESLGRASSLLSVGFDSPAWAVFWTTRRSRMSVTKAPMQRSETWELIGTLCIYSVHEFCITSDRSELSARVYDYEGEAECEHNCEVTLRSIETAADQNGFAAIKVRSLPCDTLKAHPLTSRCRHQMTALGQPELLRHMSQILHENRRTFRTLFGGAAIKSGHWPASGATGRSPYLETVVSREDLHKAITESGLSMTAAETDRVFTAIDADQDGQVDYLEWMDWLSMQTVCGAVCGVCRGRLLDGCGVCMGRYRSIRDRRRPVDRHVPPHRQYTDHIRFVYDTVCMSCPARRQYRPAA